MIFTESEFSLYSELSSANVSISSFFKLQLSRLFITRSVVFLHSDAASESIGTTDSLSRVKKKSKFKFKFPYRFTYTVVFYVGECS